MKDEYRHYLTYSLKPAVDRCLMFGDEVALKDVLTKGQVGLCANYELPPQEAAQLITEYVKEQYPGIIEPQPLNSSNA